MTIQLGVVMDPISSINYAKDSTLAMLWEAEARGWELYYFEQKDLLLRDGVPYGYASRLKVYRDATHWFTLQDKKIMQLDELNVMLMRKDPPFNQAYIYSTYILDHAHRLGVLVVNNPQALRDANEKCYASFFPQCAPPSLVTRSMTELQAFWREYGDIVCKPLDGMGGTLVFRLRKDDANANVIFELLTQGETQYMLAQQFIPEITKGDKRILLIDGEPVPYALARIPQSGDWRGNLAAGAKGIVQPLTERDRFICSQVGPVLRERGLMFVGIDVIGDYLTEINVTSPTGIREIDAQAGVNIAGLLMDCVEKKL